MALIPGEILTVPGDIELNVGASQLTIEVANAGDRPIQVGSHYHFYETNAGLRFEREKTRGMRLDIAAGTAVRFEPGQAREVRLVLLGGACGLWLPAEGDGEALTPPCIQKTKRPGISPASCSSGTDQP